MVPDLSRADQGWEASHIDLNFKGFKNHPCKEFGLTFNTIHLQMEVDFGNHILENLFNLLKFTIAK